MSFLALFLVVLQGVASAARVEIIMSSLQEGSESEETLLLFDGRIPRGTQPSDFDDGLTPYNPNFVHGQNQTWADIIRTDYMPSSQFDGEEFQAVELSLTDESIHVPGMGVAETAFRRSDLKPNSSEGLKSGITTFHFSLLPSCERPLNLSHEYQLVFVQPDDAGTHVFEIKYGTRWRNSSEPVMVNTTTANQLRLMSSTVEGWDQARVLFSTDFCPHTFHNFAVVIDWENATLAAFYSRNNEPLRNVVEETPNAVRPGQFHIGMVKLPVGQSSNVEVEGIQESGIHESLIIGGVFVEEGAYEERVYDDGSESGDDDDDDEEEEEEERDDSDADD